MSWLFSQALVAEFSEATCSDGEPSAPSSGNPTPQAYSSPDKTTTASRLSRYGMTCEPLTASRGEELLTWFRAGFHVKTSALQERAQGSTVPSQACGTTWPESLAKFDLASFTWRTPQLSLLEDLDECLETWPRSGLMRNGECFPRPQLERITDANESGSWPTPTVCGNYNRKGASATSGDGLATAVSQWATPCARDYKHPGKSRMERTGGKQGEVLPQQVGGPLNPPWVEWLMGWPEGWTDLKPLGTGKFLEWQQQHSPHSQDCE